MIAIPTDSGAVKVIPGQTANLASNPHSGSFTGAHFTLLGWAVLLMLLYAVNKTKTGHTLLYFSMVLIVLFLFLFNYQRILPLLTKRG